jgi:hypothetical protein
MLQLVVDGKLDQYLGTIIHVVGSRGIFNGTWNEVVTTPYQPPGRGGTATAAPKRRVRKVKAAPVTAVPKVKTEFWVQPDGKKVYRDDIIGKEFTRRNGTVQRVDGFGAKSLKMTDTKDPTQVEFVRHEAAYTRGWYMDHAR